MISAINAMSAAWASVDGSAAFVTAPQVESYSIAQNEAFLRGFNCGCHWSMTHYVQIGISNAGPTINMTNDVA